MEIKVSYTKKDESSVKAVAEPDNEKIMFIDDTMSTDEDEKAFAEITRDLTRVLELKDELKEDFKLCTMSTNSSQNNSFLELNPHIWDNKNNKRDDSLVFRKNYEKISTRRKGKSKTMKFIMREGQVVNPVPVQRNSCNFENFESKIALTVKEEAKTNSDAKKSRNKNKNKKKGNNSKQTKQVSQDYSKAINSSGMSNVNTNANSTVNSPSGNKSSSSAYSLGKNLKFESNQSVSTFCSERKDSGESCDRNYFVNFVNTSNSSQGGLGFFQTPTFQKNCTNFNFNNFNKFNENYGELNSYYPNSNGSNLNGFNSNNKLCNNSIPKEPAVVSKGKKSHSDDLSNKINLESILRGKDKRTTLMIRHIPNKYSLQVMLEDINVDFKGKFDVFYLPIDYVNKCNLGFAFINFVDSMHILQFYEQFRGKRWRRFNSEKICELAYAKFQGKKELIAHFEKGCVLNFDTEEKKPLILPTPVPLPPVEIPIKYFESFINFYPYSDCVIMKNKFTVNSLFDF